MRGLILGLAALVVTSPFAQAAGDSTAGRTVMVKCQSCHGKDGLGTDALRRPISPGRSTTISSTR